MMFILQCIIWIKKCYQFNWFLFNGRCTTIPKNIYIHVYNYEYSNINEDNEDTHECVYRLKNLMPKMRVITEIYF